MSDTTYVNGVTIIDADSMNDFNRLHYTIFSDPSNAATALANLLGAARTASVGVYTAWDPSDVAGAVTSYSGSTFTATSTATDYITLALSSGTSTFTCVKAGVYRVLIQMQIEAIANASYMRMFATLGGTGTRLLGATTDAGIINGATTGTGGASETAHVGGTIEFYASMTAGQTVTILPKIAVTSGSTTAEFTTQCTVSAEFTGA